MTCDELRFEELTKCKHLWPEEIKEVKELAERLGKDLKLTTVKLDDYEDAT